MNLFPVPCFVFGMVHTVAYTYVVLVLLALVIYIFNKDHCREQTQKVELPTFPVENPPVYGRVFPLLDLFAGVFYGPPQNFKRATIWLWRVPLIKVFGVHGQMLILVYHFTKVPNRKELERTALVYEPRNISQLENQGWFFETGIAMANNNFVAETCTPSKSCIFYGTHGFWLPEKIRESLVVNI